MLASNGACSGRSRCNWSSLSSPTSPLTLTFSYLGDLDLLRFEDLVLLLLALDSVPWMLSPNHLLLKKQDEEFCYVLRTQELSSMFCGKVLVLARGFSNVIILIVGIIIFVCATVGVLMALETRCFLPCTVTSLGGVAKQVLGGKLLSIPSDEDEYRFVLMQHWAWFD